MLMTKLDLFTVVIDNRRVGDDRIHIPSITIIRINIWEKKKVFTRLLTTIEELTSVVILLIVKVMNLFKLNNS